MVKDVIFRDVTKTYEDGSIGLERASFEIEKGEFVFVVGKSGSGKSTLLKLISTQLMASCGEIEVGGIDLDTIPKGKLPYFRRQFGIMERELGLVTDLDVTANISLAMFATEQPFRLIKKRVEQTLTTLGISHCAKMYPRQLSGGEAARVLLARALVINPKILIIDEPTANLDEDASWDLMCLLRDLNRMGVTMIVASHSRELVTIMRKRVITLVSGKIVKDEKRGIYNDKAMDIFAEKRVENERRYYERV
ncbi:cell division transport system ATP-binding protein [Aequitasia blattaphilus]|uniref:ATP-binding cassette domain-containing protein n=1 Tax=Aequitasia blattaphilus TaxID=2949332 RepID=A0ABT1E9N8_9FIRM|nr:ATP-binding cassette domain-containing protein [Aequitasia blattaphilus]MCP1102537.1 ATP-binding cassette domain-containing protein [Aequitasia blattaphilus]MCR8615177.1 ATP-binding cassette domain-containing protein [Aequitasia blattaphilus]